MAVLGRSALLFALLVIGGCRSGPEQWGPFRGRVVDAETGEPISGAHVMVTWMREPPSLHGTQWFYDAQETTTDTDGRFVIRRQPHYMTAFVGAPRVGFFTPGYLIEAEDVTPPSGHPYVDATVTRMRPLKSREEQCKHEPHGIGALFPKSEAPRFASAIDRYVLTIRCFEVR